MQLEKIIEELQAFQEKINEGEVNVTSGYVQLKMIDKTLSSILKDIQDETHSDLYNWDKEDLPFGAKYALSSTLKINYEEDEEYSKKKEELKEIESNLKKAVELFEKGQSLNDEDGCVIQPPTFKRSEQFRITLKK